MPKLTPKPTPKHLGFDIVNGTIGDIRRRHFSVDDILLRDILLHQEKATFCRATFCRAIFNRCTQIFPQHGHRM
jgi:hypothetical protein